MYINGVFTLFAIDPSLSKIQSMPKPKLGVLVIGCSSVTPMHTGNIDMDFRGGLAHSDLGLSTTG